MIKDTEEHSDEERHRARSGSVLRTGTSVPVERVCTTTLLACRCVRQPKSSPNPILLGFYVGTIDQKRPVSPNELVDFRMG